MRCEGGRRARGGGPARGEHGGALRWWRTACHAADDAADLELRLLVRAESAGFALYGQRDPATVLRLLDDAERIAGRSPRCGGPT